MSKLYSNIAPNEREYQDNVLKLFRDLNYSYLGNLMYAKGATKRSDGEKNSPIIWQRLEKFLREKKKCNDFQLEQIRQQLYSKINLPDAKPNTLSQVNCDLYSTAFQYGLKAKPSETETEKDILLFDFDNYQNNDFAIAEEVSYIDAHTGSGSRPDLVVYVNGIALAVIELKSCMVSFEEAVNQNLSNEKSLIPSFFTTVQFTIAASQHAGFKYGTILTPSKFWCFWKKDKQEIGKKLSDTEAFKEFFAKDVFMTLFRYGVICDGGTKKVMRPHQLHALKAAMPRLEKKQSGVIWHSQGSGKSLTMVWLAQYIKDRFPNPRVIVLTDRTELDIQIKNGFYETGETPAQAKSGNNLLELLSGAEHWLICSLIHKFGRHIDYKTGEMVVGKDDVPIRLDKYLEDLRKIIAQQYPNGFNVKGDNIFVFVDECHRTQGGKLHKAMREILGKEVMLIGFTGTPLLKDQKKNAYEDFAKTSEVKFGTFIHKYLHKEAVDDKVILDLQYEARDVEQQILSKDKLDKKKDDITKGLTQERKEKIEDRWATLEKVYSSKERIERIGYSIINDVESGMLKYDWCNAMLVAGDIYSAYKYYEFFQNICSDTILKDRCAVVTSYNPSDNDLRKQKVSAEAESRNQFKNKMANQSFADAGVKNSADYEKRAKDLFKRKPSVMKLLIVVDKLLTGFDAPSATYLYIDKEMKDHTLFQALCRVNRLGVNVEDAFGNVVFTKKEYGLIVDFKHLFGKIENAITVFNDSEGGLGNFDEEDLEGLLTDAIDKNKGILKARLNSYLALKGEWVSLGLWTDNRDERLENLSRYYTTDQEGIKAEDLRQTMYLITGQFVASYNNIADYMNKAGYSQDEAENIERLAKEAACINRFIKQQSGDDFDPKNYDPQMRALLDQFIRAEDADVIVPATAEFSFLDLIDSNSNSADVANKVKGNTKSDKSAASIIEGNARSVINSYKEKDPELYKKFSERLQDLLQQKDEDTKDFVAYITKIIDLIKQAKAGGVNYPDGIKTAFAKALWNNADQWDSENTDEQSRISLIINIETFIDEEAGARWKDNTSPHYLNLIKALKKMMPKKDEDKIINIYNFARQNIKD